MIAVVAIKMIYAVTAAANKLNNSQKEHKKISSSCNRPLT
jgi:hypothetical protein